MISPNPINITLQQIKQIEIRRKRRINQLLSLKITRWFLGTLIAVGIAATILSSYPEMAHYRKLFAILAVFSAFIFTIEFVMRLYAAPLLYPHQKGWKARWHYLVSFMGMIDFIAVLPFTIPYLFTDNELVRQAIEFGRIVIIFKLFRYSRSYQTIQKVLASIKYELLTSLSFVGIIVSFTAIMMYYVESNAQPEVFRNMGDGFWWSIVTLTTIGYGDIYPITTLGRILAGSMSIIGLIVFALPTALVSGAYINYIQQNRLEKEKRSKAIQEEHLLKKADKKEE